MNTTASPGGPLECTVRGLSDEAAMQMAWECVKRDCAIQEVTVSELATYYAFFVHGWRHRSKMQPPNAAFSGSGTTDNQNSDGLSPESAETHS